MEKFAETEVFRKLNVAFVLDEGLPTEEESYKVYYAERCPWCKTFCEVFLTQNKLDK